MRDRDRKKLPSHSSRQLQGLTLICTAMLVNRVSGDESENAFRVPRGQMTFDAEGQEGGRWHSRRPHVPGDMSGVTIGRGYDMKFRSAKSIEKDLLAAGLDAEDAVRYSGAAGLSGEKAREFIAKAGLNEITPKVQKKLFEITYAEIEESVKRICTSATVVQEYGKCDWDQLNPAIRELIVDLRYRGDYTTNSRKRLQPLIVKQDLNGIHDLLNDREFWKQVPLDRYNRRVNLIKKARDMHK